MAAYGDLVKKVEVILSALDDDIDAGLIVVLSASMFAEAEMLTRGLELDLDEKIQDYEED